MDTPPNTRITDTHSVDSAALDEMQDDDLGRLWPFLRRLVTLSARYRRLGEQDAARGTHRAKTEEAEFDLVEHLLLIADPETDAQGLTWAGRLSVSFARDRAKHCRRRAEFKQGKKRRKTA